MRIHQLGSDSPETPMFTEMLGHLASASRTVIFPQPWQVTRMRIALLLGFGKGPGVPVLIDSHPAIIAGKWQGARPGTGRVPTEAPKRQDRERVSGTPASLQRSGVVYPGQSQQFRFIPDFDLSTVPLGVDDEVGDTPLGTIKTAQTIGRRRDPQPPSERGLGDAWILVAFIIVVGLIFVVAAWVFAGH